MIHLEAFLVCHRRGIDVDARPKVHPIIFADGFDVPRALVGVNDALPGVVAAEAVEAAGADANAAGDISPPAPACYSSCRQAPTAVADSKVQEEGEEVHSHPLQLQFGLNPTRTIQGKDMG